MLCGVTKLLRPTALWAASDAGLMIAKSVAEFSRKFSDARLPVWIITAYLQVLQHVANEQL
jgi:hypothetical protein